MIRDMTEIAHMIIGGFLPGSEPRFMPPGTSLHFTGHIGWADLVKRKLALSISTVKCGGSTTSVAGNGVIPTSTACNPTLTSVALALHCVAGIIQTCHLIAS